MLGDQSTVNQFIDELGTGRQLTVLANLVGEYGANGSILWARSANGRMVCHECCRSLPEDEMAAFLLPLLASNPDLLCRRENGTITNTLLFEAISAKASLPTIQLVAAPELVAAHTWGQTPLHLACCLQLPVEVIEFLVQLNPRALRIPDSTGDTPLHRACIQASHPDLDAATILFLVDAWPEALYVRDSVGALPHEFASAAAMNGGPLALAAALFMIQARQARSATETGWKKYPRAHPPFSFLSFWGVLLIVKRSKTYRPARFFLQTPKTIVQSYVLCATVLAWRRQSVLPASSQDN
jgi:hypothetical protein